MNETVWRHENGARVTINNGSAKPPLWVLNLVGRVVWREALSRDGRRIRLRWTKGGGGGRFYAGLNTIAVNAEGQGTLAKYVLLHELAHWVDWTRGTRFRTDNPTPHGDGFHDALYRIARDEGCLRLVQKWHTPKAPLTRAGARLRAQQQPYDPCPTHPTADRMHGCATA